MNTLSRVWRQTWGLSIHWPVADYVLPHELCREFSMSFIFGHIHILCLDHDLLPNIRLRSRVMKLGLRRNDSHRL